MEERVPTVESISTERVKLEIEHAELDFRAKKKSKFVLSKRMKIGLLILILVCICLAIALPIIYFMKDETKVQEYRETQYNLLVRSEITVQSGGKLTTTFDNYNVIFFALDMKGDKYRILLTKGSLEEKSLNFTSVPLKPDYFIYLELDSKSAKILEARYKKNYYDDSSINMLIGITQVFVVDQESEWEYSSQCKKTGTKTNQCTHNSKTQVGSKVHFQRKQSSEDRLDDDDSEYEHTSNTWVDSDGKVEKSQISGWYSKAVSDNKNEKINFNVSATVVILSTSKIQRNDLDELNDIVEALPVANQSINSKRFHAGKYERVESPPDNEENDKEGLQNIIETNGRMLASGDERMLFDKAVSYQYFKIFKTPFYINSRLYSATDKNKRSWFCGIHRFEFGGISLKLLKNDICLSSHNSKVFSKMKMSDFVQEGSQKVYFYKQKFNIFTFDVYATVKVKNTPYVQTYYNTKGNTVTNVDIDSQISVLITGEGSSGASKAGLDFTISMKSNIDDYMVGYSSPFSALVSLDKSIEGSFEIWVTNLKIGADCYTLFGAKVCLPAFEYKKKKSTYKEKLDYKYYQTEFIFNLAF